MRCFTSLALAGAFGILAVSAQASDMAFPPMEGTSLSSVQPTELGTGWYLRGDVAWSRDNVPTVVPGLGPAVTGNPTVQLASPAGATNAYSIDVGFGYKFNNWLRADILYDYRKPQNSNASNTVWCPYSASGLEDTSVSPVIEYGYFANPNDTCNQQQGVKISRQDLLLNGYVDLGTWGGVTPYIGAGIGFARTQTSAAVSYFETANNSPYAADLTPQTGQTLPEVWVDASGNIVYIGSNGLPTTCPTGSNLQTCKQPSVAFTKQNWNKKLNSTKYGLAWDLTGGFAIDVTDHLKLDLNYRYVNLGTFTGIDASTGQAVTKNQSTQEIRMGFRYMVD